MLQVITGKFYDSPQSYDAEHRSTLYTNIRLVDKELIELPFGRLQPSTLWIGISTLSTEILERIEKDGPPASGTMISAGGAHLFEDLLR